MNPVQRWGPSNFILGCDCSAQALSQVDGYLRRMPHPEGVREAVSDTAGAAQMIADHGWRCASWPPAQLGFAVPAVQCRLYPLNPMALGTVVGGRSEQYGGGGLME